MEFITKRHLINNVAANWKRSYADRSDADIWQPTISGSPYEVWLKLDALNLKSSDEDDSVLEKQIEEIIGNSGWTELRCDHCRGSVSAVYCFQIEYQEAIAKICRGCLEFALQRLPE